MHNDVAFAELIQDITPPILAARERIAAIREEIKEHFERARSFGVKRRDIDAIIKLATLPQEEREERMDGMRRVARALNIAPQYDLFGAIAAGSGEDGLFDDA